MMQVPVVGFLSQQRSFNQFLITLEQEFGPGPINSTMVQPCTLDPQPSTLNPERKNCVGESLVSPRGLLGICAWFQADCPRMLAWFSRGRFEPILKIFSLALNPSITPTNQLVTICMELLNVP